MGFMSLLRLRFPGLGIDPLPIFWLGLNEISGRVKKGQAT